MKRDPKAPQGTRTPFHAISLTQIELARHQRPSKAERAKRIRGIAEAQKRRREMGWGS